MSSTPQVRFVKSAVLIQDLPKDLRPEVAILGRSNAGKSSLINSMYETAIAKVSSSPGKTRTINFFNVGDFYRVVDMPGYGFAVRARTERKDWQEMIENYLSLRSSLVGFVLVMDIRRAWSPDESELLQWLSPRGLPLLVVLTKSDKVSSQQILRYRKTVAQQSRLPLPQVVSCSNLKRVGGREVEEWVFKNLVKPQLGKG